MDVGAQEAAVAVLRLVDEQPIGLHPHRARADRPGWWCGILARRL